MAGDAASFAFNPNAQVRQSQIGRRGITVTQIDNILQDPEGVAALGFTQTYTEDRSNLYPGMRAPVPESFSGALRAWLAPILQRPVYRDTTFFSVVTTASRNLLPIQCIPHYDSTDPDLLAAVIYLCDSRFPGTSFYRHRRTGYEEITAANRDNYKIALDYDMRTHGVPRKEYANGDSLLFEAIFSNPLKFNSAILYPGRVLHAANIPNPFVTPRDKSEWRLTVTALLQTG